MRVIEASTHCVGLFLAQPAEQEFGSPSQNLLASVCAHHGEDQQHPPCPVWDRLTLASAPVPCMPRPTPPQGPCGDRATTPRLGAVSTGMDMDTGQGWSRGDGTGFRGCPNPALNVEGCERVLSCGSVAATLPGSTEQCPVWTSQVAQPSPPAPPAPPTHSLTTGFPSRGPKLVFLGRCQEVKLFCRERCTAHFRSFVSKALLPADAPRR